MGKEPEWAFCIKYVVLLPYEEIGFGTRRLVIIFSLQR